MNEKDGNSVNTIIISCETIRRELEVAMERTNCHYPVLWLESGLHNVPKKLNTAIQTYLDDLQGYNTVLLAMSLCGNSVIGLRSHDFQLVLPRCDDCISLLLDGRERPFATLFMTEGWLKGGRHLGQEYDACIAKYGEKRGTRIFEVMLKNYRSVAMLDTGCYDTALAEPEIRAIGKKLGLEYTRLPGSPAWLEELLRGDWKRERFVILPPNDILTAES